MCWECDGDDVRVLRLNDPRSALWTEKRREEDERRRLRWDVESWRRGAEGCWVGIWMDPDAIAPSSANGCERRRWEIAIDRKGGTRVDRGRGCALCFWVRPGERRAMEVAILADEWVADRLVRGWSRFANAERDDPVNVQQGRWV